MFYGPNGSGKTSLCEALELALLGSVDEASAKRIQPQRYFTNVHEKRFEAPVLAAVNIQGQPFAVSANSDAYRFCFIEKNRIDNFSRIAAKTAGEKKDLIASLFGMEQFHDFVANFNESLDAQLGLNTPRQQELATRRAGLQRDQATIDGEAEALQLIACQEEAYAGEFNVGLSYAQLLSLIGTDEMPGRLHELTTHLDNPGPVLYGVSSTNLLNAYRLVDSKQQRLIESSTKLAAKTGETSFQNLYTAVLGLQTKLPDRCPACETPLTGENRALRKSYIQAQAGLAQLKDLAELQTEMTDARRDWEAASHALEFLFSHFAQRVSAHFDSQDDRLRYLAVPGVDHSKPWWQASYVLMPEGRSMAQKIVDLACECQRVDAQNNLALAARAQMAQERAKLMQAAQHVAGFKAQRGELKKQVALAKRTITEFNHSNADLIDAEYKEALTVAFERRIKVAYDEFLRLLKQFRSELPGTLIAGLNTTVLEIYNEFNRRDHDGDKLAALLPTTEDGRIELAFRAAPQVNVDALPF